MYLYVQRRKPTALDVFVLVAVISHRYRLDAEVNLGLL